MVLAGVLSTYLHLTRSFFAISNYTQIHADGRTAVDWFAKDMRCASGITSYSAANLTVVIPTNFNATGRILGYKTVSYTYANGAYRRYDSSTGSTSLLATNVFQLTYTLYDHVGNPTALTNNAKSLQVDVKLRKYINNQTQTEEYLSGRYDLRNKP